MTVLGIVLLYAGVAVTVISVIGLFRFRTPYTRVKSLALATFPGAIFIHVASSLLVPFDQGGFRGIITALLFLLSGPIMGHVILLASHKIGLPRNYKVDDLRSEMKE